MGIFFVLKSECERLRLISDARIPNQTDFLEPPPVELLTGEGLGCIELDFVDCDFVPQGVMDAIHFILGLADVKDCFHRYRVPLWLAKHFAWLPVKAKVIGLAGHWLDGRLLDAEDAVYPLAGSLCQGFAWALFLAQRANERVAASVSPLRDARLMKDRGDSIVLRVSSKKVVNEIWYYVYVDNLGVLGAEKGEVDAIRNELKSVFGRLNLTLHAEGLHGGAVDALGVTVDGGAALTTINVDRMWKIRQGIRGILQRGRCSGVVLEVILGHCTFAALVNRLTLSIFDDCYKFMKANYFTTTKLWPSVIEELAAFGDGIFLLEQSWTRQWNQLVGCGDASLTGYGICHSWWPKHEVASVGRISERSRFRRTQFHSAREAALISAGFAKVSGRCVPQGSDAGKVMAFPKSLPLFSTQVFGRPSSGDPGNFQKIFSYSRLVLCCST